MPSMMGLASKEVISMCSIALFKKLDLLWPIVEFEGLLIKQQDNCFCIPHLVVHFDKQT